LTANEAFAPQDLVRSIAKAVDDLRFTPIVERGETHLAPFDGAKRCLRYYFIFRLNIKQHHGGKATRTWI
jgi:hypothetical protein